MARIWRNPIGFVAIVEILAFAVGGPLDAWIRAHLSGELPRAALDLAEAAVVAVLFVRGGWWPRTGTPSRTGVRVAAAVIAATAVYLTLRPRSWHDFSVMSVALAVANGASIAVMEELIWRGWVLGAIEPRYGVVKAVLVSSVLFGVAHLATLFHGASFTWAVARVVWATCVGVLLAGLLKASRTYWMPIAAHALFDCVADLDRAARAREFPWLGMSLDMLVAAPVMVLVGAFLCFQGLRTLRRSLTAVVCTAGIVLFVLVTWGSEPAREASPVVPRVIRLESGGEPMSWNLRLAVPKAWGGRLETRRFVSSLVSEERGGGSYSIEICVPDRQIQHAEGEQLTSTRLEFPCAGRWEIEVRFKDEVIWQCQLEIGSDAPAPSATGGR